jgi:hypothetical protein
VHSAVFEPNGLRPLGDGREAEMFEPAQLSSEVVETQALDHQHDGAVALRLRVKSKMARLAPASWRAAGNEICGAVSLRLGVINE